MTRRIGIWALCGLAVAVFWFLWSLVPGNAVNLGNSTIVAITAPVALLGRHHAITYSWSMVINAAIYAVVGLVVETIRIPLRSMAGGLRP